MLTNSAESLPISAKNQFLEQRAYIADGLSNFLKYSHRTPVAFYNNETGRFGSLLDQLRFAKAEWHPEYHSESKDEWDRDVEKQYEDLLPWDKRSIFVDEAVDVFNWYFPLVALAAAGRDRAVPDYLQRQILLTAWTRAVLLNDLGEAVQLTPDVIKIAPQMAPLLNEFLRARPAERAHAGLFIILKFPNLSPYVASGLPSLDTSEDLDYYFETAWWCELPLTEYNDEGQEVRKNVHRPDFLTAKELQAAAAERKQLDELGAGKSHLGRLVLEWAKASPQDPRVPEALFIAFKANENYKYGCDGWEHNDEIRNEAETLLREKYPGSDWTARLLETKDR